MARKIIDLSIAIENAVVSDPEPFRPKVKYFGHDATAERMAAFFPGLTRDDLPDGEGWAEERDPAIIRDGHNAGREVGYCHIEKLHNLEVLPAHGFEIICLPVKIKAASAGWTRAVAILDE